MDIILGGKKTMNNILERYLGIALSMWLLFFVLPTAFGTCDQTIEVYAGQQISLSATPNTPAGAYDYLWTTQGGITLPSDVTTDSIVINAPIQGGLYSVTVYVLNHNAPPETCIDSYTVCIDVIGTTYCPLCSGEFCETNKATSPDCPPYFHYTGLTNPNYIYHYVTLDHTDSSGSYLGMTLYEGSTPDYTLDWTKLDQPEDDETTACTTLRFWITQNGVIIGTACERTICLYYSPTAGVVPVY
jgi:hypothetical protein